jgi:hypothetical protein
MVPRGEQPPVVVPPSAPGLAPQPPREPPSNPWVGAPAELTHLLPRANLSRGLDKKEMARVHEYNAKHTSDPRGHLLLARSYVSRRWFKDAINEYQAALSVSDASRGDPRFLRDLLTMVELGSGEAAKLVVSAFGNTAVPAIDKALAGHLPNLGAKELLERLRREAAEQDRGAAGAQ